MPFTVKLAKISSGTPDRPAGLSSLNAKFSPEPFRIFTQHVAKVSKASVEGIHRAMNRASKPRDEQVRRAVVRLTVFVESLTLQTDGR